MEPGTLEWDIAFALRHKSSVSHWRDVEDDTIAQTVADHLRLCGRQFARREPIAVTPSATQRPDIMIIKEVDARGRQVMLPPQPENTVFGIEADGRVMKPGFPSADKAEGAARGLFEHGYKNVEIIDLVSRRVVKRLTP